jgi:hypothetical protein
MRRPPDLTPTFSLFLHTSAFSLPTYLKTSPTAFSLLSLSGLRPGIPLPPARGLEEVSPPSLTSGAVIRGACLLASQLAGLDNMQVRK